MHVVGEGSGATLSFEAFPFSNLQLTNRYITSCYKLGRGHSFCPLLICMSEAFSVSFILKWNFITQKLWAIKPLHWPLIEFFSSRGQESGHCSWLIATIFQFDPWVGKIPWEKWQPTPLFLLGNYMDRGAWRATALGVAKQLDTETTQHNNNIWNLLAACRFYRILSLLPHLPYGNFYTAIQC